MKSIFADALLLPLVAYADWIELGNGPVGVYKLNTDTLRISAVEERSMILQITHSENEDISLHRIIVPPKVCKEGYGQAAMTSLDGADFYPIDAVFSGDSMESKVVETICKMDKPR